MVRGAGAIVVLGCRVLSSGEPSPTLSRRARAAADAYHAGVASRVVAAGGRRWQGWSEARAIASALGRAGVPDEAVILELCSLSTTENAIYTAPILRKLGATRAIIATSAWHMPRALANFRAAGIDAHPLPVVASDELSRGFVRGALSIAWIAAYERACMIRDARAFRRARAVEESAEWFGRERLRSGVVAR